jgi:cell division protein FtsQ
MTVRRRVRVRLRVVLAVVGVLVLLGGAWLWLRDSPLVAVDKVTITGVSGPGAGQIRALLTRAAHNMTTLDVRRGQLRTAVAPYAVVKDVEVSTQFPHGMRIHVIEQLPVGALEAGGQTIAATGDGTLLHAVPTGSLPIVPVRVLPGGSQATDGPTLQALALLADTPRRLLRKVQQVSSEATHGLVVQLRSGPAIYFGDSTELVAKWVAATEVLGAPSSAGATYIDVTDPARPDAGVSAQAVTAAGLATAGSQPASGSLATGPQVTGSPSTGSSSTGGLGAGSTQAPAQTSTTGG